MLRIFHRFRARFSAARLIDDTRFILGSIGVPVTDNENRLKALHSSHTRQRGFIIGNGPSLSKIEIGRLSDEITIASNGIFLIDDPDFRPTYYTVEDKLVAEDRGKEISELDYPCKIFPIDLRYCFRSDHRSIYVNFVRNYRHFPQFSEDFQRLVYWGGTVTFMNLQLAYYLGIREVYLIGMDHEYSQPAKVDLTEGNVIHSKSRDPNHFHPDYFGPGYRWHDPRVDRMETAYRCAKDFFDSHGGRIFNASVGGKLEVFPRVQFDKLF